MTKKELVRLGACVVSAVALQPIVSAASGPTTYRSDEYGYTITVPADWAPIPEHQMRNMQASSGRALDVEVDAGFYNVAKGEFGYPYVLMQATPYGPGRRPTESDMRELLARRASARPDTTRSDLSPGTKSFVFEHRMNVPDLGQIRVTAYGHFGRRALVEITCYSMENEFPRVEPVFRSLESSFAFDPDTELEEQSGGKIGNAMWIVLAAPVAVLALLFLRRFVRR